MSGHLVFGAGFLGLRVVERLRKLGHRVVVIDREPARREAVLAAGASWLDLDVTSPSAPACLVRLTGGALWRVLWTVPPGDPPTGPSGPSHALGRLSPIPLRLVHLSSTCVYGETAAVDERTPACAGDPRSLARLRDEGAALRAAASTLVLRAAAIYGPGRGVRPLGPGPRRAIDPDRVVSRIHVDDLAALCVAALDASVEGVFPVADEEPASQADILAALEGAAPSAGAGPPEGRRGCRVAGRALPARLGVRLQYPSFRTALVAGLGGTPGDLHPPLLGPEPSGR